MLFITQDIDEGGMSYVMLNIALFDTLGRHFGFLFDIGDVKGIHFARRPTNSSGGTELVSSLNLPMTFALMGLYKGCVLGYALVS